MMNNGETISNLDSKLSSALFQNKFLFLGPENIALTKTLQRRTESFIQSKLEAPSLATLKQWVLEDNPDIEWKTVKKTVRRFRNSLPIVSRNTPDGRATSARSQYLPRAFRSPAWVAADLGDFELRKITCTNSFQAS